MCYNVLAMRSAVSASSKRTEIVIVNRVCVCRKRNSVLALLVVTPRFYFNFLSGLSAVSKLEF